MSAQDWVSPVVAVGVSGHRTLAEPVKLRKAVDEVLALIRETAEAALARDRLTEQAFALRIVSPVAEGADRLVAEAGLAAGAVLQCALPLPRDNYAEDFQTPASKKAFHALLAAAERVFELDEVGPRDDAYLEVGRLVLSQSDILIAIWDGEPARGRGGTAEIVAEAMARHAPVVWLKPDMADPPVMISGTIGRLVHHDIETLRPIVERLVIPPAADIETGGQEGKWSTSAEDFLKDRPNVLWILANTFNGFTKLILLRFSWPKFRDGHWLGESLGYWAAPFDNHIHVHTACLPCLEQRISGPFARADALASAYAGLYRSTFLVNFGLSALAVGCGVFGATGAVGTSWIELISIAAVIGLTWLANKRHYHERWVDYRHLAEQIRPLRYLFPLALPLPRARSGHFMDHGQATSWTEWLVHRLERELGLPNITITPAYLNAVHDFATDAILDEQIDYHRRNKEKLAAVDHRLHVIGLALFALTAVVCILDLIQARTEAVFTAMGVNPKIGMVVLYRCSGILPALGAAFVGVRNIGEFARLELRSKGMEAALEETKATLTRPPEEDQKRLALANHLENLAVQMMSETADWRTLVITRHIELPA